MQPSETSEHHWAHEKQQRQDIQAAQHARVGAEADARKASVTEH